MTPSWSPSSMQMAFVCYRRQRVKTQFGDQYLGPYDGLAGYKLWEICISGLDGSNRKQLTDNLTLDYDPSWSPDDAQVVFVSSRDTSEGANIYVMQSDGTNPLNLTDHAAGYRRPRWSPDGYTIAFVSTRDNIDKDLYTMAADGSRLVRLTEIGWILNFDWSPDGKHIVFDGGDALESEIYVVDVEDGSIVRLTNNRVSDFEPVWSPDGRHIAFSSEREDGVQVYVIDMRMSEAVRVSKSPELSRWPSWSPNRQFLSYVNGQIPNQSLHILDLESEISTTFPDFQALDRPVWSPDSQCLIYECLEDWNEDGFKEVKLWALQVDDGTEWAVSSME